MRMIVRAAALAACATAAAAGAAAAGEAAMRRPIEAASLDEGPFHMAAYFTPAAGGAYEVVATFAPKGGGAPSRIVMALAEGDAVAFALPGRPDALYGFARAGGVVTATVRGPWAPAAGF